MRTTYDDTVKGGSNWSFATVTEANGLPQKGGVILKDLIHDGHHFAKDIRLIAAWVTVDILDVAGAVIGRETTRVLLRATGPMTASPIEILKGTPLTRQLIKTPGRLRESRDRRARLNGTEDALDFKKFFISKANYGGYGLRVKYVGNTGAFDHLKNFEFDRLDVTQTFLFSSYGISPPHEPGGVVAAARFHPMLKYAFVPNPKFNAMLERRVLSSIRFDYRMQLYIDALYNAKDSIANNGNSAGVFRDTDDLKLATAGANFVGLADVEDLIFDAAEKPLIYEITAPGLAKGASTYRSEPIPPQSLVDRGPLPQQSREAGQTPMPVVTKCWDNLHWWGGGVGKNIISTPGAFHAAHLHWRWGALTRFAPHGEDGQFAPGGVPAGAREKAFRDSYGVLVDPQIWIQSVRFAVTLNDPELDPERGAKISDMTKPVWRETFQGLRAHPQDISMPSDIVLWYSIEVHRRVTVEEVHATTPVSGRTYTCGTQGTIFIHGIFFAHDAEKTSGTIGGRRKVYIPKSENVVRAGQTWERASTRVF